LSTSEITAKLDISDRSVRRIAKKDLHINAFRRSVFQHKFSTPVQNKSDWSVPQLCFNSKFVTRNVFSSPTRKTLRPI